jgi:type IV pilus assembly protein PilC
MHPFQHTTNSQPCFFWFAQSDNKRSLCGFTAWPDIATAEQQLSSVGMRQIRCYPNNHFWAQYCFKQSFHNKHMLSMLRALDTLLSKTLPFSAAISKRLQHKLSPWENGFLLLLQDDMDKGMPLIQAFQRHRALHPVIQALIGTGLSANQLSLSLKTAHQWCLDAKHYHQSVNRALRYPLFIFITAMMLGGLLFFLILPNWLTALPALNTSPELFFLLRLHQSITESMPGLIVLLIVGWRFGHKPFHLESIIHHPAQRYLAFFWPTQMQWSTQALWCKTVHVLRRSGVSWTNLCGLTLSLYVNTEDKKTLQSIQTQWQDGKGWLEVLIHHQWLPEAYLDELSLAEATHRVTDTLGEIAHALKKQHQTWLMDTLCYIEPCMMLLMGLFVGTIAWLGYQTLWHLPQWIQ